MTAATETIEIQNVVASTGIDQELDLETLAEDMPRADFNPDNFHSSSIGQKIREQLLTSGCRWGSMRLTTTSRIEQFRYVDNQILTST